MRIQKMVAVALVMLIVVALPSCADKRAKTESDASEKAIEKYEGAANESSSAESGSKGGTKSVDRELDFELGLGLPTMDAFILGLEDTCGYLAEDAGDGVLAIYGSKGTNKIGQLILGSADDNFLLMIVVDKEAGDNEEDGAKYCLKYVLASVLGVLNEDMEENKFDVAEDIIQFGTTGKYVYGYENYEVGNVNDGQSYAIKVTGLQEEE